MAEKFEYKEIKSKLKTIRDSYKKYINAVNSLELALKTELDISSNSALFNAQGNKVVKLWEDYGDNLGNFIYIFEKWIKSTADKYNNIIKYEKRLGDNLKITKDIIINPISYSDLEINTLSKLLSGDSSIKGKLNKKGNESIKIGNKFYNIVRDNNKNIIRVVVNGNETIIHHSLYENSVKEMYEKYNNREITEEEWNSYLKKLNPEATAYLEILSTNALVVNAVDVISLLESFELNNNDAERIARTNRIPEDSVAVEDEVTIDTFLSKQQQNLESFQLCGEGKLFFTYDFVHYSNNSYIEKIPYEEDGQSYYKYKLVIDGKEKKTYEEYISIKDYLEAWHTIYPKIVTRTYSKIGKQEYNKYKSLIEERYKEYKDKGVFYLDINKTIYYKAEDGEIHYFDDSILKSYSDDLNWYKFWIIDIKDKDKIKDLFMIANGYIEYKNVELHR